MSKNLLAMATLGALFCGSAFAEEKSNALNHKKDATMVPVRQAEIRDTYIGGLILVTLDYTYISVAFEDVEIVINATLTGTHIDARQMTCGGKSCSAEKIVIYVRTRGQKDYWENEFIIALTNSAILENSKSPRDVLPTIPRHTH